MRRWLDEAAAGLISALSLASCAGGGYSVSEGEARCRRLCEAAFQCVEPGSEAHIECFTQCDDLEAINEVNECDDEVDLFYDCIEKHGACADIDVECEEPQAVFSDCLADPCSTDPDRDVCL
jgi:hypothetical protein